VTASASSGLPVTFTASGNCTVAGIMVTVTGVGSCTVTASQAGDANYLAAPNASPTVATIQAKQEVDFGSLGLPKAYGDKFPVTARASSGLPVTFAAADNCTIAGIMVTVTGVGSCKVTASQGGDLNYLAAPNVPRTVPTTKANQTITFDPIADKVYPPPSSFTVSPKASSALPVTFTWTGNCTVSTADLVTLTGKGTCAITARQSGSPNYNAAPDVLRTFTIK
jgi:hypothetical protein